MINSNQRKLTLSGWLKNNNSIAYDTPLKLQKFLLLYEVFTKVSGEKADFSYLKGYEKGPVFSNVWGDYTKERADFNKEAEKAYRKNGNFINDERARKTSFIVSTLTEPELSDLTHLMNIWKSKEKRIMKREYQVDLDESDFNNDDRALVKELEDMYPMEMVDNSIPILVGEKCFVVSRLDYEKLNEHHRKILNELSDKEDIHNPVFVTVDGERSIIID